MTIMNQAVPLNFKAGEDIDDRYSAVYLQTTSGNVHITGSTSPGGFLIMGVAYEPAKENYPVPVVTSGVVKKIAGTAVTRGHTVVNHGDGKVAGVAFNQANNARGVFLEGAAADEEVSVLLF